jgi:nucleoside phosphorylase
MLLNFFTCGGGGPMLPSMLLIASALAEELETILNLCSHRSKVRCAGIPIWQGMRAGKTLHLLKLGSGPAHSASVLERALAGLEATRILVIGYAGALDPDLKQGELVAVDRADLLSEESWGAPLSEIGLGGSWPLPDAGMLYSLAHAAGLPARRGSVLTSPCIIGAPEQKRMLFQKFHDAIVDMETAALARIASALAVPLGCVRAVSDEAGDDLFAFLSYDPDSGSFQRAAKTLAAGGWLRRYSQWRQCSLAARQSLSRFLTCYLDQRTDDE